MPTWTNEPSGATTLLDHNFNVALGSGMSDYYHRDNPNAQLTDLNEAWQVSPTKCYKSYIVAGSNTGGTELAWANGNTYTDMFVGIAWRTNAGFEGRPQGNKMFFIRGSDSNGVFLFNNERLNSDGSGRMLWGFNTGGLDNSHITGTTDPGVPIFPNVGPGILIRGTGYKLEAYCKKSTTNTSRDGIIKWWINGVPAGSYTNINYAGAGLSNWVWSETWDGTPNFTVTTEWDHYLDHLYISTGGTLVSGGTQPPTTDPPTQPQPQVVLSSISPSNLSTVVGTSKQFTISMSAPVASSTSLFTTSSNTAVATVPSSVTIPTGGSTALVTATPLAIGSTTISTSYNGVTKAATLQVGTSGTTSGSTVYDYSLQFSGTQGSDNWYYLENTGTQMTYSAGLWTGTDAYGGNLQTIWDSGFHPGGTRATVLRFVVPASGSATITGSFYDLDTAGGVGCVARVQHNGATLFTRTINNGDSTGGTYSLSATVAAGDTIDFVVANQTGDYQNNSTSLNPIITLSATTSTPQPPEPPTVQISVVDLFTTASPIVVGSPFTMTVRVSETVTADTAVQIRVGSTSVLSAPTSVTIASGNSSKDFTVTPLAASLVAIEAVLNGTKRVTLNVQPSPEAPIPPIIDPKPETDHMTPTTVTAIRPAPDGARLTLSQRARALAFTYDAQPDWQPIVGYNSASAEYTHTFTWPSGTTKICYRAQNMDGDWGAASCVPFTPPAPPPVPPSATKAVIDKAGVRWQLSGKRSPYVLKRNGSTMDHTYGVKVRKSSDGYLELLQPNGIWLRRNGDAWEHVE